MRCLRTPPAVVYPQLPLSFKGAFAMRTYNISSERGTVRRGLMSNNISRRTGHEYHEYEGDTLEP